MQASEKVKEAKKNRVLRDRDCWLQGPRTRRKKGRSGKGDKVRRATTTPSGVSRIICIIRVESFSLGALMGLWDPRFGYTIFFFSSSVLPPERGKEVKIRIASILYFVINDGMG